MSEIKNGDSDFFDSLLKTAKSNIITVNHIPKDPVDPKLEDFGQFRIRGSYDSIDGFARILVSNGYSVTVKELRDSDNKPSMLVMYRYGDL